MAHSYLPILVHCYFPITPEHSIGVFDMGFASYKFYSKLTDSNRYFVTRKKDNATYEVVREFDSSHAEEIQKDQLISLKYKEKRVSRTVEVRLVTDPVSRETLEFMTNLMGTDAITVALLYKNRWVIDLLFKQLKQVFELKYFLSDSETSLPAVAGDQDPDMASLDFKPAFHGAP